MAEQISTFAAIVVPIVGALAWLFRLEGRVDKAEGQVADVKADVRYIRDRIDRALDGD
jgi:hypothetical protein